MDKSFYSDIKFGIKTPQLIGIIFGCIVFSITLVATFCILLKSGILKRALEELQSGNDKVDENNKPKNNRNTPKLYQELLDASSNLSSHPQAPKLETDNISVVELIDAMIPKVISIGNGDAIYGESAYDPSRIWYYIEYADMRRKCKDSSENRGDSGDCIWPIKSEKLFKLFITTTNRNDNYAHYVIMDKELCQPIGMISLLDNLPEYLTIRIGNIWLTPAFQGKKRAAHEAVFLILSWLFDSGYRRVTVETDSKHYICKKFLIRCGFQLEATLRKHKIIDERNSDTAIFTILNSDWPDIQFKISKWLKIPLHAYKKVAEIK